MKEIKNMWRNRFFALYNSKQTNIRYLATTTSKFSTKKKKTKQNKTFLLNIYLARSRPSIEKILGLKNHWKARRNQVCKIYGMLV